MNKETLRMQMLAGLITESQYKQKLNEFYAPSPSNDLYDEIIDIIENSGDDYLKLSLYVGGVIDDATSEVEQLLKSQESYEGVPASDGEVRSLVKITIKKLLDELPSEVIQDAKDEMGESL
jgi:hypothetical protein